MAMTGATTWGLTRSIIPLEHAVNELSAGKNGVQARVRAKDEIGQLAHAFNTMAKKLDEREIALIESKERAEAADRAKSTFLATMSHEIRTPMNAIVGYTDLLLHEDLPQHHREYLQIVQTNGDSLLELINDVLDYSKIEAGKLELASAPVNPRDAIKSVFDSLSLKASQKGIKLETDISPACDHLITGDPMRIRQVLMNLTSNAVKFTQAGIVSCSLSEDTQTTGGPNFLFVVRDTGIGIEPSEMGRLFKPFSQTNLDIHDRFGGTGLGLAICKKLVTAMGGQIWCESAPGKGSAFFFSIPATPARAHAATKPSKPLEARASRETAPATTDADDAIPIQILVVEDHRANRDLLMTQLGNLGGKPPLSAPNGKRAIELLREHDCDLILMDLQMPELDGMETVGKIRAGEVGAGNRTAWITAVTAFSSIEDKNRCENAGFDAFLTKPVPGDTMRAHVRQVAATLASKGRPIH